MSNDPVYGFTKIVVDDLDRMAAFYQQVFGYRQAQRVHGTVAGEPIADDVKRDHRRRAAAGAGARRCSRGR